MGTKNFLKPDEVASNKYHPKSSFLVVRGFSIDVVEPTSASSDQDDVEADFSALAMTSVLGGNCSSD